MKLVLKCLLLLYGLPQVLQTHPLEEIPCSTQRACDSNLECLHGFCQCEDGEKWNGTHCIVPYDGACQVHQICQKGTSCVDNTCKCLTNRMLVDGHCIDVPKKFVPIVAQNYKKEMNVGLENLVFDYLNLELLYNLYASFFSRADVSLPGFSKYFKGHSRHMGGQALALTQYINTRGGVVNFKTMGMVDLCTDVKAATKEFRIRPHGSRPNKRRPMSMICEFIADNKNSKKNREDQHAAIQEIMSTSPGLTGLEDQLAMEHRLMAATLSTVNTAKHYNDPVTKHNMEEFLMLERPAAVTKLISRLRAGGDYTLTEYEMDMELAE